MCKAPTFRGPAPRPQNQSSAWRGQIQPAAHPSSPISFQQWLSCSSCPSSLGPPWPASSPSRRRTRTSSLTRFLHPGRSAKVNAPSKCAGHYRPRSLGAPPRLVNYHRPSPRAGSELRTSSAMKPSLESARATQVWAAAPVCGPSDRRLGQCFTFYSYDDFWTPYNTHCRRTSPSAGARH